MAISEGCSCLPVASTARRSAAVVLLSLIRVSLSSFEPGHQCTAFSSWLSNASRIAAKSTLLNVSSGSLMEVKRDWRDVESTVNSVWGNSQRSAIISRIYKLFDIASAVDRISAVALLLVTQRCLRADHRIGCAICPGRRNIMWPLRRFLPPAVAIEPLDMM